MNAPDLSPEKLVELIKQRSIDLGFDAFGIAPANSPAGLFDKLENYLGKDMHAGMQWMADTKTRRSSPKNLWGEAKSVIVLGMSYAPHGNPLADLQQKTAGNISVYARNRDYHGLIKGRLKEIAGLLARAGQGKVKVFVDTAPVMEKPLAEIAGLGWQGKNTILTSSKHGAWLFLGEIFTDLHLPVSASHRQNCGTCTACLDICPTSAFPQPFVLDARKCLAYYNNEHHGPIPLSYRKPMGNRIFGCDDCLAVCPWNKFARQTSELKFRSRTELNLPPLSDLLGLDDKAFRAMFSGSPVKRLGLGRFLRNVLIAAGNSGEAELVDAVKPKLKHSDPVVRGAAIWAIKQLLPRAKFVQWRKSYSLGETVSHVQGEWLDQ